MTRARATCPDWRLAGAPRQGLSDPGFLGMGGYVTGTEKIGVSAFEVPRHLKESASRVTARGEASTRSSHPMEQNLSGTVGTPLTDQLLAGTINLLVAAAGGKAGRAVQPDARSRLEASRTCRTAEAGREGPAIRRDRRQPAGHRPATS